MRLITQRVDPRPVAAVRIVLGIVVVLNALETSVVLHHIAEGRIRVPVLDGLPAPTALTVQVCVSLGVLAGVALAAGFFAGPAALAATILNVWVFLWDQQTYSNTRLLGTLLVAYLVFAQSDATWAVRRRPDRIATVRWWPQLLVMTQVSTCYLFAALSKVNPDFVDGGMFAIWLRWPLPDPMYQVMALATIATELFLAVALWWARARVLAVCAGAMLHLSIVVGMKEQTVALAVFGLTCVCTYALFLTRPSGVLGPAAPVDSRDALVAG